MQDCIERALRRAGSLDDPQRLAPWLRSILYNLFLDDVRRRRGRGTAVDMQEMENDIALSIDPGPGAHMRDVMRATQALSAEHRQILLLVGVEGLSYREAAEELGVQLGTVMSRLARARAHLRDILESGAAAPAAAPAKVIAWRMRR